MSDAHRSKNTFQSADSRMSSFSFISSPGEVQNLWTQFRRDEPHLLSNFEEFLARVTVQIKEAYQEKKEMESALQR